MKIKLPKKKTSEKVHDYRDGGSAGDGSPASVQQMAQSLREPAAAVCLNTCVHREKSSFIPDLIICCSQSYHSLCPDTTGSTQGVQFVL